MQLSNPFKMNDWEIKKFLKVVLAIQLAMWGVIGLDDIGLQIPILRQSIAFLYLIIIPGILLLRIIQLHRLSSIETLLYTVGLSITALMFIGLSINIVYPIFGIHSPISIMLLTITLSVVVLILCVLCYIRDKDFSSIDYMDFENMLSPNILFLLIVPSIAVIGTYFVNSFNNSIYLMLLIFILAMIIVLIAFDMFVPISYYPFAVFIISISLLYHTSLISMYIWGFDIHEEFVMANSVIINSHWDPNIGSNVNAVLSISMLAPIYSIISDISVSWTYKIIYPLLFSLVPLGLYHVFQRQTNDQIAFLSCIFFVSLFTFYTEMLSLARQQIAELFLVLLIMLIINKNIERMKRSFLFIVFGVSLAVSHYALSYIYMFCLISAWIIAVSSENSQMQKMLENLRSKLSIKIEELKANQKSSKDEDRIISSAYVFLFIITTMTWYIYVSNSSAFNTLVEIGHIIGNSIFTEILNPSSVEGLGVIVGSTASTLHSITKYIHLFFIFLIFTGAVSLILKSNTMKFEREYAAFSLVNLALCFAGIILPYFANALNTTRLYQIAIIILAPFCIVGWLTFSRIINRVLKLSWTDKREKNSLRALAVILAVSLLLDSGWVYEVMGDHPSSIALSQDSIKKYADRDSKLGFYDVYVPEQDVFSAIWLSQNRNNTLQIYADILACAHVLTSYARILDNKNLLSNITQINDKSYVYLSYLNIIGHIISEKKSKRIYGYNTSEVYPILKKRDLIYTNGGSCIYQS